MRILIIALLSISSFSIFAIEQITLTQNQIDNLDIKLGTPKTIKSVPILGAPAKVSIPPANNYIVSTSQAGLVNRINVSIGENVKKVQVLASIKSPELLALQRHHMKSIHDLRLAKTDYIRDQKLYKEGVIADRRWLKTKASYQVFKSHFNETRQLLEISGISKEDINSLEKNHKMSSQLNITSPITGVILQKMITAGERVDALVPMFRVANLDTLWLDISVPQQRIDQIHMGDSVLIDNMDITAKVFLLGKNVHEQNQTVLVRAVIETNTDSIRLGQTISVKISQANKDTMFKIPNSALAHFKGKSYIFIRNKTGFTVKPVQILGKEQQQSIISAEIQLNNEMATTGAVALKAIFLGLGDDE